MTSTAPTYTKSGASATTAAKLDASVFAVMPENHELLKLAYTAYLANGRGNLAQVKTRGLVSGGGRKPWKQKGTGRARFGSIRVPIWRGGGITFGPTGIENFQKDLTTKAKRQAVRQALSVQTDLISVIESFDSKDGKTAPVVTLLKKLGTGKNVLLVVDNKDSMVVRATRNIDGLKVVSATYLNVFDLLNADSIVMTAKAVEQINDWLGEKK